MKTFTTRFEPGSTFFHKQKRQPPRHLAAAPAIRILLPWLLVLVTFCCGYTTWRTQSLYGYVKTGQRGWSGRVHRADADLGFAPIPDFRGAEVFPIGTPIPMRYDENGFSILPGFPEDR